MKTMNSSVSRCLKVDFKAFEKRSDNTFMLRWGMEGEMRNVKYCNTFVNLDDKVIPQFLLADISGVVESIKRETGLRFLESYHYLNARCSDCRSIVMITK